MEEQQKKKTRKIEGQEEEMLIKSNALKTQTALDNFIHLCLINL